MYRPAWEGSGTTWTANNVGGVSRTQDVLNKQVVEGHKAGWQMWIHANGDRAQDMVLTAYEAAQQAMPRPDARHRIEHFAHFLTQDASRTDERLARMLRGKIIPAPQVAFLWLNVVGAVVVVVVGMVLSLGSGATAQPVNRES